MFSNSDRNCDPKRVNLLFIGLAVFSISEKSCGRNQESVLNKVELFRAIGFPLHFQLRCLAYHLIGVISKENIARGVGKEMFFSSGSCDAHAAKSDGQCMLGRSISLPQGKVGRQTRPPFLRTTFLAEHDESKSVREKGIAVKRWLSTSVPG